MSIENLQAYNQVLVLFIFVLSIFVGFEVISKVPSMLHTPLMSGTNAIHGIVLIGALLVVVYWLLQRWFTKVGMRGSTIQSAAVAVGGVAVRMMLVIIVLVAIALTDRTGFLTAAITFLSVFALYYIVNYALVVR